EVGAGLRGAAQTLAQLPVIDEPSHGLGQSGRVARGEQHAGFPIHDHVYDAAHPAGHHRLALAHRLYYGYAEGLGAKGWLDPEEATRPGSDHIWMRQVWKHGDARWELA